MGWFGSSSEGGDTSGASWKPSSDSLDLSGSGFDSKKKSSSDFDFSSSGGLDSSAYGLGSGGTSNEALQRSIQMEQQKLELMAKIHEVNDICWDTCVDSVGNSLSSKNESCIKNCSERFVDVTLLVTNRFAQLAQKMQYR